MEEVHKDVIGELYRSKTMNMSMALDKPILLETKEYLEQNQQIAVRGRITNRHDSRNREFDEHNSPW